MHNKLFLCGLIAGACSFGASTVSAASLLVLSKGDHTLAVVDVATLAVKGRVPSGPDPHEVVASTDGKLAWISNYGEGNGATNTLSVVDLIALKSAAPIDLGALSRPHGLTLADGKLYFTAEGAKVIGRYDPVSSRIEWVMGTGQNRTHMVIVSNDLKRIFTTNVASGTVSILEQSDGGRGPVGAPPPPSDGRGGRGPGRGGPGRGGPDWNVTVIPVGRGAEGFDLSPGGKELWAANAQDSSVSIIDVTARKVVQTLPVVFRSANRLKFTPDGKHVLISDLGGDDLIVIDAVTRKEVKRIPLGAGAAGIQIEPNGGRAFVAVGSKNHVAVIDLKSWNVSGYIEAGREPDGLAWVQ